MEHCSGWLCRETFVSVGFTDSALMLQDEPEARQGPSLTAASPSLKETTWRCNYLSSVPLSLCLEERKHRTSQWGQRQHLQPPCGRQVTEGSGPRRLLGKWDGEEENSQEDSVYAQRRAHRGQSNKPREGLLHQARPSRVPFSKRGQRVMCQPRTAGRGEDAEATPRLKRALISKSCLYK